MNFRSVIFRNDTAVRSGEGEGGGGVRRRRGEEQGKINRGCRIFPGMAEQGIHCGGIMIYVRGGRAVRVRQGRRCAPIMINAPPLSRRQHSQHSPFLPPSLYVIPSRPHPAKTPFFFLLTHTHTHTHTHTCPASGNPLSRPF